MTISFKCAGCQKEVRAPDDAAGKRGKCPYCSHSNYIPAPVAEDELPDLAPIDDGDEKRRAAEIEALRKKERQVLAEQAKEKPDTTPLEHRKDLQSDDLHHFVVNYCLDLANSKLDRIGTHAAQLKKFGPLGQAAVEDFVSGKASEPALKIIPSPVLKGFLLKLREDLKKIEG